MSIFPNTIIRILIASFFIIGLGYTLHQGSMALSQNPFQHNDLLLMACIGNIFSLAKEVASSFINFYRTKVSLVKRILNRRTVKSNKQKGVMAVEIQNTVGIGARLEWVLEILAFCDENQLTPLIRFTYPGSDKDYFESFFTIKGNPITAPNSVTFIKIYSLSDLDLGKNYDKILTMDLAAYLIKKYLAVQDEVLQEVDAFCATHFQQKKVLAVHYRGTDKVLEAPVVSYENVINNIKLFCEKVPGIRSVFVSSDDANFIKYINSRSLNILVISRDDAYRSDNNEPVHRSQQGKYDINRDAIVNCLLLSRCDGLLKSASILSGWSVLFNPTLPIVLLNLPFDNFFPERELRDMVLYDPV